jgi:enoyl-CoA hydratase
MVRLASLPVINKYGFQVNLLTRAADTDNQELLNHATYFALIEEARTLYLQAAHALDLTDVRLPFVQHSVNIRFVSPGQASETLTIKVATIHLGTKSFIQSYVVTSSEGEVRVECMQVLAMSDTRGGTGLPKPMTPQFRKAVAVFENTQGSSVKLEEEKPMHLTEELKQITNVTTGQPPFRFRIRTRTRFVDEDLHQRLSGRVYWSLMEEGRLYYFSGLGLLPPSNAFPFVLHSSNMRYYKSGRGGIEAMVEVKTLDLGASSFSQHYRILDATTGELWAEATQVFVCWDVEGKKKTVMGENFRKITAAYDGLSSTLPASVTRSNKPGQTLKIGDWAELVKQFAPDVVTAFSEVSEDRNPLHLSAEFAAKTQFKKPIVHGALVSSLFSGLLGLHLPGPGTVYLSQSAQFSRPVLVGDTVRARVTVKNIREDKPIVTFATEAFDAAGKVVVSGEAVIIAPKNLVAKL